MHWVNQCVESWKKIKNAQRGYYLLPDSNLKAADESQLQNLGFEVFSSQDKQKAIVDFLKDYPSLSRIREVDVTWRKLLDTTILLRGIGPIVLIDTDVLVVNNCTLPVGNFDICYMREDIPAYRADWKIVWKEKMVPAFNAGMVIYNPDDIDFNYLEYLTKKYFLGCKDYWWTEQSAWACIAGRMERRMLFDGHQVRVLSGFNKRSPSEVLANDYNYFGKRGFFEHFEQFRPFVPGSSIIHFAGYGKKWFKDSVSMLQDTQRTDDTVQIRASQESTLSLTDKVFIGARLFLKELK
jgi:hypothetical protein